MAISSKICRYIVPDSETDSNYEQFEFLLVWYGRDGALCPYMFTDWEHRRKIDCDVINEKDQDNMENLINSSRRTVKLIAEDLSLTDLEAISSILEAKKILRVYKDETFERIGLDKNSFRYRQTNKRYNLEFTIILYQKALPQ